ncbi:replication protein A 32 kDa subunit [Diachasma alloeum]|uniref:replication protein A 32 kDa subunit n=1 Tax=Diachasma alloeum TaxID=454923 RepID=UPI0007384050|nr:replication protein A 32 kDa subunit [Diachasma alloeum]
MWGELNTGESEGGFMDESYNTGAQQTQKEGKKREDNKIILPIMIGSLLHETPQSLQQYGNNSVSAVRVVAVVTKITEATTKIAYELEDETGKITGYRWLETDSTTASDPMDIKVNQYVIIHGCLRESGEESRHLFILNIRPSVTHGEVLNHLLEVTMAARHKTIGLSSPKANAGAVDNDDPSTHGLTPDQGVVFKLIKQVDEHDIGIERNELKSKVPPQLASKVDEILDFLVSEGHIYTTRTDDHFKAT